MHENGEPASLGFIEVVAARDLELSHEGLRVGVPTDSGRVHGVLGPVCGTVNGDVDLVIDGRLHTVQGHSPVTIIVQTAAEAMATRRAAAAEQGDDQ